MRRAALALVMAAGHAASASPWTVSLEGGVETCITQCVSANNDTTVDCLIAAKTAEAAKACASDD